MARLMRCLAPRIARGGPVYDRILAWPGDISPRGASVPLRLAGALHRLVLADLCPGLAAVYPPHAASDAALLAAVEEALAEHAARIDDWIDSPPQTNEVRRSAALIAAAHWLAARHRAALPPVGTGRQRRAEPVFRQDGAWLWGPAAWGRRTTR